MGEFLSVIVHSYHESHGVFALPLAALILSWSGLSSAGRSQLVLIGGVGLAVLVLASYAAILAQRVVSVLYGDHLEALVAAISWLVVHGGPGYPDWRDGDLYGGIYGPLLFWINGLTLMVWPAIAATKLVAAVALALGGVILWRLSGRAAPGWAGGLVLAALIVEQLLPYRFTAYWIRSEPFLYLLAVLALLAGERLRPISAALTIGLLAGLAIDLKIHAALYMMPIGLLTLARAKDGRDRALCLAAAGFVAIAAAGAPLLADHSVILLYREYLALAAGHGISTAAIVENLEIAAALAAAALIIFLGRRPILGREDRWFLAGLTGAALAVIVLGSKNGALANYLMPLTPSFFFLTVKMLSAPARAEAPPGSRTGLAATALLVVFACNAGSWFLMVQATPALARYDVVMAERRAEFLALVAAYPNAETGAGDNASYEDSYFSPLQVISNGLLRLAVPAWMDLREGGIPESYATRVLEACAAPAWIMPAGPPFSLTTPYTGRPLFSDEFRVAFAKNYEQVERRKSYTVWQCRGDRKALE